MQSAPSLRRLDELVLEHLASQPTPDIDELAVTGRFVRPYERVEIQPQRTFARTVRRESELDVAWFAASEEALVALDEPAPIEQRTSWWWLAISVAAGAAAVVAASYVL